MLGSCKAKLKHKNATLNGHGSLFVPTKADIEV